MWRIQHLAAQFDLLAYEAVYFKVAGRFPGLRFDRTPSRQTQRSSGLRASFTVLDGTVCT